MTLDMHDDNLVTLSQLEGFTNAANVLNFAGRRRKAKDAWIEKILHRFCERSQLLCCMTRAWGKWVPFLTRGSCNKAETN